ncbi:hypothetical protein ABW21_db0203280 [Orbilia brochopaga]|nr:hypothetical protein ABW21_db0203280 [Drechslerella brochopaga]
MPNQRISKETITEGPSTSQCPEAAMENVSLSDRPALDTPARSLAVNYTKEILDFEKGHLFTPDVFNKMNDDIAFNLELADVQREENARLSEEMRSGKLRQTDVLFIKPTTFYGGKTKFDHIIPATPTEIKAMDMEKWEDVLRAYGVDTKQLNLNTVAKCQQFWAVLAGMECAEE